MPSDITIIGGGITGLSAAYFCKKKDPTRRVILYEQSSRLGGHIQTSTENGFLFEKGPRTFRLGHSPHLLSLLQELNLPIITSPPLSRYIVYKGKLRNAASFLPWFIPHFFREPFIKPATHDESIYTFASRRFSSKIANTLFDPLTLGIYAGDIHKLSIRACFPKLHEWEQTHGSLLLGLLRYPKKPAGLFTIPTGMQTLINALAKYPDEIHLNATHANPTISAIPLPGPKQSLHVVNLVYSTPIPKQGFGYLIPTQENHSALGVIFDSSIFTSQNQHNETRLTVMVRATESQPLNAALDTIQSHLKLKALPIHISHHLAENAVPQFPLGAPSYGVSVEDSIKRASEIIPSS